jgi:DNA-binding HxlR family transcriptional regulator
VKRSSVGHLNCSVARALDVVGEWWTLLVLRDVFFGVRRFEAIQADLGIARNVLSDRLATLVEHGILERRRYQEHPERFEYVLTDMGRDLFPVLLALMGWGDRWLSPEGPPLRLVHLGCGHETDPSAVCSHCGAPLTSRDVRARKGPGWHEPGAPVGVGGAAGG